jgi:type I restriction enzyme M protein
MPKRSSPGKGAASHVRLVQHIEEIVLASSGEDAFELVFGLAAGRVTGLPVAAARRAHPELGIREPESEPALTRRVEALLARVMPEGDRVLGALDAIFEVLVPRLAKGDKGQYFTPRNVVELVISALAPAKGEVVVDPACGSGGFLAHARGARTFGCDVDARAVRVARLIALAQGRDPEGVARADGLVAGPVRPGTASVVATNPPFAGRAPDDVTSRFELSRVVRTPERDALFLERALDLLRPGGRLGIVLPYNKAAGAPFAGLRRWLLERARVFAVVGLPRETFMPHTSQRTFVLFAKKRSDRAAPHPTEKCLFVVSERAGKDAAGERSGDDDLGEALARMRPFLDAEGFAA